MGLIMNANKLMSKSLERVRSGNSNLMQVATENRGILQNLNSSKFYTAVLVLGLLFGAGATYAQSITVTFDEAHLAESSEEFTPIITDQYTTGAASNSCSPLPPGFG